MVFCLSENVSGAAALWTRSHWRGRNFVSSQDRYVWCFLLGEINQVSFSIYVYNIYIYCINICILVLDWEMEQGLGVKLPAEEYSHCYKRTITDLLYNMKSEYASQFIDLHTGRAELNHTLYQAQQNFIHNIHSKVRYKDYICLTLIKL